MIAFFKKSANTINKKDMLELYKKYHQLLVDLEKDPYEKVAFNFFDYIAWFESKITQTPITEILQKKANLFEIPLLK